MLESFFLTLMTCSIALLGLVMAGLTFTVSWLRSYVKPLSIEDLRIVLSLIRISWRIIVAGSILFLVAGYSGIAYLINEVHSYRHILLHDPALLISVFLFICLIVSLALLYISLLRVFKIQLREIGEASRES